MNPNPDILIPVSRLEKNTLKKIALENERNDLNSSFQNNFAFVRINESDLHYLNDKLTKKIKGFEFKSIEYENLAKELLEKLNKEIKKIEDEKIKLAELEDLWNSSKDIRAMFGVNR